MFAQQSVYCIGYCEDCRDNFKVYRSGIQKWLRVKCLWDKYEDLSLGH